MRNFLDISNFQQTSGIEFVAKQIVEGFITGMHRSPFHGFSVEFAEYRAYNTGESTRHIDWKLYARTDKLFTKRFEEETNLRCRIVIDTSSSMLFKSSNVDINKLQFSAFCGGALIHLLRKQRDAVALSLISDKIDLHTPARLSSVHEKYLFAELDKVFNKSNEIKLKTDIADQLHFIAENSHKRSLIVIFSDFFEANTEKIFDALQHLCFNKHEVIVFHVIDKDKEALFNYNNRPYRFVDMETGEEIKINPNDIRDDYQIETKKFFNELNLKTTQYKIDFVEVDISKNFADVLNPFLVKRTKLF